ncbi:carbamoyltransferase HypF [Caminibacter profundus]
MRIKYTINGIVQGVGFRPTVYKIAKNLGLKGFVLNSSDGVIIEIEGVNKDRFIKTLKENLPPLAKIDTIKKEILPPKNYKTFEIAYSKDTIKTTSISPDIAVCEDCLKEMFDKSNRRYLYPFINCTNCGPRYTIIENIPYDRQNTSMKKFKMCENCKKEYTNPLDRRFHAEPISCFECGPKLIIKSPSSKFQVPNNLSEIDKVKFIADKIKEGKIVAIKGLGGFHLVCDATNPEAVSELRIRKNRPLKPFAMMFKDIEEIKKYCEINKNDEKLILSKEKPIVLVKKRKKLKGIADNTDRYGVFLPYTPVHYLLFEFLDTPIVATSANISDEPIIRDSEELIKKLGNIVDFVLDNDRDIVNACDDSVVQVVGDKYITMRCARGYAPYMSSQVPSSKFQVRNILAVGANQKNTISLAFKDKVILSPHIGDLGTLESLEYFERTIDTFRRLYEFKEDVIICDKHPYYESTKWALKQEKKVIQIQHHYAHVLSTMFEFNLDGDFLAFAFDGTGYGDDGAIWGGEVFIANRSEYKRIHHFRYFKLIGGEKAIKNPANMAVSLIDENLSKNYSNEKIAKTLKNASFPITSSLGRIFDMVAFLSGMIEKNDYEGLSGLIIEKFYNQDIKDYIELEVNKEIDFLPLLNFAAKNRGDFEKVASVFLNSIVKVIEKISKEIDLPIILSGGVFQNKTLLSLILKNINKKIYFNQKIPINDGGISLGQVAWGIWNLK